MKHLGVTGMQLTLKKVKKKILCMSVYLQTYMNKQREQTIKQTENYYQQVNLGKGYSSLYSILAISVKFEIILK